MITKISRVKAYLTTATAILILAGTFVLNTGTVNANLKNQACGAASTAGINNCSASGSTASLDAKANSVIPRIVNTLSIIAGSISVIMIVIGGFRYVISGGEASSLKSAKDTIIYALVGLIIVLFAQVIVRFVLKNTS